VVILVWLLLLVGGTFTSTVLQPQYDAQLSLPASPAQKGATLLEDHSSKRPPAPETQSGSIVFHVSNGTLESHRVVIGRSLHRLSGRADVASVSDPYEELSPDGRVAIATVTYRSTVAKADTAQVVEADRDLAPVRGSRVAVDYGGDLGGAAAPPAPVSAELIGIGIALIVLLLAFGSVLATVIPVVSAAVGVFAGLATLGTLAAWIRFPGEGPTIALMLGLGVGIDYALFLSTRFRQLIIDGRDPISAAGETVASSGRAVVIAAATVVISLLGLYAAGIFYIGQLGVAASVTVLVAALSAITLGPALLAVAGRRIDALRIRRPVAEPSGTANGWLRYGRALGRHPVVYLVSGFAVLAILAVPVLTIRVGTPDISASAAQSTERRSFEAVERGFGAGYQFPLTVVVHAQSREQNLPRLATRLHERLRKLPGVASMSEFQPTQDRRVVAASLIPTTSGSDSRTAVLVHRLDQHALPSALAGERAVGYVTGGTAAQIALDDAVSSTIPIIVLVVVGAAMLLMLVTFRSPVLALKAGLVNLLSIGASYGVLVAVFQWGWGSALVGTSGPVPIVSFVPMLMFAIVFGLSMDYEVFLLARVREAWRMTGDNAESVSRGLSSTGRIISCAAVIMASVFFSFLLDPSITIKMLALGLGVSVIIDATIVRLIIVPAAMHLFGRANWWTPRWLDRALPHLEP
jgi:RND superfamily putative drug exporter